MQLINNLSSKINKHQEKIRATVDRVLNSGWLILGPEVQQFEKSFADFIGTNYCVSLANGTDAIELALKSLGITAGDRVATVANAGCYTTIALLAIGAEPYYMDVDLHTQNVSLPEVMKAIDAGVKAIVVTHLYGLAVSDIKLIAEYCVQHHIQLLEDCAQAHGAKIDGRRVGSFGTVATFSFYPTKNLGALGDGGAIVTNDQDVAKKVTLLRQYGWNAKYQVDVLQARNSRLDELQAAILSEFLPHLDEENTRRRMIAAHYSAKISHPYITVPAKGECNYVAHLYVVKLKQRDKLRQHLFNLKISSDVHYPIPDYRQPVFAERFSDVLLSNTERLAKEVLTLPCYPEMSDDEVNIVIEAINGWQQ